MMNTTNIHGIDIYTARRVADEASCWREYGARVDPDAVTPDWLLRAVQWDWACYEAGLTHVPRYAWTELLDSYCGDVLAGRLSDPTPGELTGHIEAIQWIADLARFDWSLPRWWQFDSGIRGCSEARWSQLTHRIEQAQRWLELPASWAE